MTWPCGEFEEKCGRRAVLVVFGIVGQARQEAANGEGEEQVPVVDVVAQ